MVNYVATVFKQYGSWCRNWADNNYLCFHPFDLQDEGYFTLRDLKGNKLSGSVFNILFNLNKFMAYESRDPFLIRQVSLLC